MEAVDLGLSVLWGDDNLYSQARYMDEFFNWGRYSDFADDVWSYRYVQMDRQYDENGGSYTYFDFCWEHTPYYQGNSNGNDRNNASAWSKYTTSGQILDLSDDIAHILLGGKWRMPTEAEWQELIDNCNWVYTPHDDTEGNDDYHYYTIYGKKSGYTNNSIILDPGAGGYYAYDEGYVDGTTLRDATWEESQDDIGDDDSYNGTTYSVHDGNFYFWTSTMGSSPSQARGVRNNVIGDYDKRLGFLIRPVCDK